MFFIEFLLFNFGLAISELWLNRKHTSLAFRAQLFKAQIKLILDQRKLYLFMFFYFCYLFTVEGGFFITLRLREIKFVIYNLIGPNFGAKPPLAVNK